jgi:S-DNA-T family DNA segregation ATPase FtsK/SpoIIIE
MTIDRTPATRRPVRWHTGGPGAAQRLLGRLRARLEEQQRAEAHRLLEADLRGLWREACFGVGLCQYIDVAAGMTIRTPRFGSLRLAPAGTSFTVELLPGGEPDDITKHAARLAHSLGFAGLRVQPLAGRWLRVVLFEVDPLASTFRLPDEVTGRADDTILLGRAEDGTLIEHVLASPGHLAVQGQNGSGKTQLSYGLLAQLCAAADVLITGSDITGLLLGRVWDGSAHRPWQVTGSRDLVAHADHLDRLVAWMDSRLDAMPPRRDSITPTTTNPLVLVVLEEFPGLLRAAQVKDRKLAERITSAVLRLLSEGRKAAFRVLMLAQRFEANAVGGGYARDQFAVRLSFRVPAESLAMLHGDDARALGAEHANAAPGVAYLSAPGHDCTRLRAPYVGGYGAYCDRIARHGRRPVTDEEAAA